MIIYVDKNGKEIERVEGSTYTYVDKSGKVIKVDGPKASKKSEPKAAKPAAAKPAAAKPAKTKKVVKLKREAKDKK
tara:strand:- start:1343 stop:1570 length:228 start_codon:yes stop_codon:yes gene_type:complete